MPKNSIRKEKFKKPEKWLIVTEGQLTEVKYLRDFARELGIRKKVYIPPRNSHSNPISVFRIALALNIKQEYKKVFCVIDRDEHNNFNDAITEMEREGFIVIVSNPCIEYWFLLHYVQHQKKIMRTDRKSASKVCKSELKKHIKNYKKNIEELFYLLKDNLTTAKKNAKATIKAVSKHGNPSTEVHLLIKELEDLSKKS